MTKRNLVYATLSLLTVLSASALFYFWQKLLANPFTIIFWEDRRVLISALFFAGSAALFLSFDSLLNLLVKNQTVRAATYSLVAIIFGTFTLFSPVFPINQSGKLKYLALAFLSALALLLALGYFSHATQKAINEHIRFSAGHILGPRLSFFITILGLILAGQFFLAAKQGLPQFKFQIPDAVLNQAFQLTEEVLSGQVGPGAFLGGEVQGEFDQSPLQQLPPELIKLIPLIKQGRLPPAVQEEIKRQLPPDLNYEQFKQMVQNIPINKQGQIETHPESKTFRTNFVAPVKKQVQEKVDELIKPYRPYLPFVLAVLFFLILKSFGFIIDFLAVLLLSAWIGLLRLAGLVEEKAVSVEAKRLELKD